MVFNRLFNRFKGFNDKVELTGKKSILTSLASHLSPLVFLLVFLSCSSIDCPMNNTVYTKYGLYKNDGTVDTTAYTTNTGTVTSTGGTVAVNNIQVVSALPASPETNTLYLITGS